MLQLKEMIENFRRFETAPDPFGRVWDVEFRWQQNGITIRHADTVDVKFNVWTADRPKQEMVIALAHPALLRLAAENGTKVTDPWCMKLAALHLKYMLETGDDIERTLAEPSYAEMERGAALLAKQ